MCQYYKMLMFTLDVNMVSSLFFIVKYVTVTGR